MMSAGKDTTGCVFKCDTYIAEGINSIIDEDEMEKEEEFSSRKRLPRG